MNKLTISALASLMLFATACDRGGGVGGLLPAGPDKEPATMTATSDYEAAFEGTDTKARFFVRGHNDDGKEPLFLSVSFDKMPAGSVVVIGDSTQTADSSGAMYFDVDLRDKVVKLPLEDLLNGKVELDIPMKINMKGYKEHTFKVPKLKVENGIAAAFATVRDRPLSFKGEGDAPAGPKSLVSVEAGTSFKKPVLMGPAKKLSDIDYVGVRKKHDGGRSKQCDGYKKVKGSVTVKMIDYKVELYDRREGKLLKEHIVEAEDRCPMFVSVDKSTNSADTYARVKDVESWLREELRALSASAATNTDTVGKD